LNSPTSPLSASWWHHVTEDMEENPETFDKYNKFSWKSSPLAKECIGECKQSTICSIRAGKSEQRCDYESDVFMGEQHGDKDASTGQRRPSYKPEPHNCAMNLLGINARIDPAYSIQKQQQN
jgi:sphingomyelin phosphodiesterase